MALGGIIIGLIALVLIIVASSEKAESIAELVEQ